MKLHKEQEVKNVYMYERDVIIIPEVQEVQEVQQVQQVVKQSRSL